MTKNPGNNHSVSQSIKPSKEKGRWRYDLVIILHLLGFTGFSNIATALPAECLDLTASATYLESTGVVCLQKIAVSENTGTQYYKASLRWMGETNPDQFQLVDVEADSGSQENSPTYSLASGELIIPKLDVPKTYGTERYSANLALTQVGDTSFFTLSSSDIYNNPDYVPNQTLKPYGLLTQQERRAVDLLGESMPYATLAEAVYDFDNSSVDSWELIEQESTDSGMQAGLYRNRDTDELVLAFRGTEDCDFSCSFDEIKESVLDIAADALLAVGEDGPQFRHAYNFALEMGSRYPDRTIVVTGHSLGGGLAQAIGAAFGVKTFAFNSAPVPDDFFDDHPTPLSKDQLNETVHVIGDIHDPVSNTDESGKFYRHADHVSPIIQFDFDEKEILPDLLPDLDALRFNKHGMAKWIENSSDLLTIYEEGW